MPGARRHGTRVPVQLVEPPAAAGEPSEMYHDAGSGARDSGDHLHAAGDEPTELIDRFGVTLRDDVVGTDHVIGGDDAR